MSATTTEKPAGALATLETVSAAASAIVAEGGTPSVRGVRERIGGGSPNSITRYLREWHQQRPAVVAQQQITIDPKIHDLLAAQIATAVSEATKAATAERDARADDLAQVEQQAAELEARLDLAEKQAAELREKVQHQSGQLEAARAALEAAKADAVATTQQTKAEAAAAVKQAHDDAAKLVQTAQADAHKQVTEAQNEAAAERKKNDAMTRQLGAAEEKAAEAERLRASLAELTADHKKEHAGRVDAEKKLAVEQAKAAQVDGLAAQVEALRQSLAKAEIHAAKAQAQADERAATLATLKEHAQKAPEQPKTAAKDKARG